MDISAKSLQLADFMDIFSGDIHNYGVHQYSFTDKGKEEGKNSTVSNKLLTLEQYKAHLDGKVGLGVIPIDDKGDVKFGVIDIDVYDDSLQMYLDALAGNGFPLVPFRSKSGGIHLYMFMKQAVKAKAVIELLNDIVVLLGLDLYIKQKLNRIIEIFPKQAKVAQGGIGSWINLPYYNAAGETRQYAIIDGKPASLDEALAYIKDRRRTLTDVRAFLNDIPLKDGPPCLQTIGLLNNMGPHSGRNNYLFSLGVYLKKADPEFWEQKLFEANSAISSPLKKDEVESTIVNSLRKKDYIYKCNDAPCVDFCRKTLCKKREFGIGKEGGYFSELEYGRLMQIKTFEPYYEWEVKLIGDEKFKTLRFKNEADIIGQDAFLRLCVRELYVLPIKMKQSEWYKLVNQALSDIQVIGVDKDDDTTPIGLFKNLFTEFLTNRAMAQTKEQIFNKRVYFDEKTARYYFRTSDLSDFVFIAKGFRYFAPGELHGLLKDFKAAPTRIKTESGRQLRVYAISVDDVKNMGTIATEVFKAEFVAKEEAF